MFDDNLNLDTEWYDLFYEEQINENDIIEKTETGIFFTNKKGVVYTEYTINNRTNIIKLEKYSTFKNLEEAHQSLK